MKFNLGSELQRRVSKEIKIGDVYPARGGKTGAVYWVVVGISGDWKCVRVLGVDENGDVVSATSYNPHSLQDRPRVGFVKDLDKLEFDIELV